MKSTSTSTTNRGRGLMRSPTRRPPRALLQPDPQQERGGKVLPRLAEGVGKKFAMSRGRKRAGSTGSDWHRPRRDTTAGRERPSRSERPRGHPAPSQRVPRVTLREMELDAIRAGGPQSGLAMIGDIPRARSGTPRYNERRGAARAASKWMHPGQLSIEALRLGRARHGVKSGAACRPRAGRGRQIVPVDGSVEDVSRAAEAGRSTGRRRRAAWRTSYTPPT